MTIMSKMALLSTLCKKRANGTAIHIFMPISVKTCNDVSLRLLSLVCT